MKKAGLLTAVLVLCLSLLGVGYASWTDVLQIFGFVSTGTFDVIVTGATSNDAAGTNDPGQTQDVASTTLTVAENQKSVTVQVSNAYPGYTSQISCSIKNNGTIPAKVSSLIEYAAGSEGAISVTLNPAMASQEIAPGASFSFTLQTTVEDSAAEGAQYEYTVTLNATQFNVAP